MSASDGNQENRNNVDLYDQDINARPATRSEVAYRDGYVQGRIVENSRPKSYQIREDVRENDATAKGLMLGVLLTAFTGLVIGSLYVLNSINEQNERNQPILFPLPSSENSQPSNSEPSNTRTNTIIERERVVPVPQQNSPAPAQTIEIKPSTIVPPKVEVNVPESRTSNPSNSSSNRANQNSSAVQSPSVPTQQPQSTNPTPSNDASTNRTETGTTNNEQSATPSPNGF